MKCEWWFIISIDGGRFDEEIQVKCTSVTVSKQFSSVFSYGGKCSLLRGKMWAFTCSSVTTEHLVSFFLFAFDSPEIISICIFMKRFFFFMLFLKSCWNTERKYPHPDKTLSLPLLCVLEAESCKHFEQAVSGNYVYFGQMLLLERQTHNTCVYSPLVKSSVRHWACVIV